MCAGFARGFSQCMEGERDPRNLLLCFEIIPKILSSFVTTQEEAEALFSAASCYFPITFTPPPNDTVGITTSMLRDALLDCLTADRRFCTRGVDLALGDLLIPFDRHKLPLHVRPCCMPSRDVPSSPCPL